MSSLPLPSWCVRDEHGHVTAGEIVVRGENRVDARILLDNALLYQSRHASRAAAERELAELRQQLTACALGPDANTTD